MRKKDSIPDERLVNLCKANDKRAFSLLVERWHKKLFNHAYWYIKDKELAKDVLQESWILIYGKIKDLKKPESFGSWAMSIVNRKSIDSLRRKNRVAKKLEAYKVIQENYDTNSKGFVNDNSSIGIDNSKVVVKSIKELPNDQQHVLRLFYLQEYSIAEISNILKVSKGTVKSRLFYAREKLKLIIKNKNYEKQHGRY